MAFPRCSGIVRPFRLTTVPLLAASALAAAACGDQPGGPDPDELRQRFDLRTLGEIPYPPDNQPLRERILLGRLLFFDPILSGEKDVACGTCHHPDFAFADGRQFGAGVSGVGLGPDRVLSVSAVTGDPIPAEARSTPTIFNTAFAADGEGQPSHLAPMFWDGRAVGLEGQATMPVPSRTEMRGDAFAGSDEEAAAVTLDSIIARLRGIPEYVAQFRSAFPDEAAQTVGDAAVIDNSTLARAIAAYERELVTRNAPFDRFVAGDDGALTAQQREGLESFFTTAKCFICHRGPMFSNFQFMVTGVPRAGPGGSVLPGDDTGREEHTGRPSDRYRFRVPTLRNVALTAPYMHDGVFATLDEVLRFYSEGTPRHDRVTNDDLEVVMQQPLGLTQSEVASIIAFLESLTDAGTQLDPLLLSVPTTVPSGLTPVFGLGAASGN